MYITCALYENIPRDAVRIISGFSELVAIAVTHPPWPSIEPA